MAAILRVRDNNGNITEIPAIVGPAGETITSFQRTSGTGAPGTTDTYTMTTSAGKKYTFTVHNGKDGGLGEEDVRAIVAESGGGTIVTISAGNDGLVADKTLEEVAASHNAGKTVVANCPTLNVYGLPMTAINGGMAVFSHAFNNMGEYATYTFVMMSDGAVDVMSDKYPTKAELEAAIAGIPTESDVFFATYGETTVAELEAAFQAGKALFCESDGYYFPLSSRASATYFKFVSVFPTFIDWLICDGGTWSEQMDNYPVPNHKNSHKTGGGDALTPADIGAEAAGTAASAVSTHNASTTAHEDIRQAVSSAASAAAAAQTAANSKAPAYTYGTTDLTAGTSELATGTLHFVYE